MPFDLIVLGLQGSAASLSIANILSSIMREAKSNRQSPQFHNVVHEVARTIQDNNNENLNLLKSYRDKLKHLRVDTKQPVDILSSDKSIFFNPRSSLAISGFRKRYQAIADNQHSSFQELVSILRCFGVEVDIKSSYEQNRERSAALQRMIAENESLESILNVMIEHGTTIDQQLSGILTN